MIKNISLVNYSDFQTSQINKEELEEIIRELVKNDSPDSIIDSIDYTKDGIIVTLDDDQVIEIEIDWNEITVGMRHD
jgi:hypothetical protein